ncbi:hypothetical protein GDO78_018518 [Eleutherodactylus coqui]|uniref:Uncharacterized protein n=1 Tax=Eleutherodactylus coqui TaxID=57060 RepID=A0A8J6BKC1_ELECQ|nr:hypothetical protein GDO78_018518 [Eleutherodactylus coqui]
MPSNHLGTDSTRILTWHRLLGSLQYSSVLQMPDLLRSFSALAQYEQTVTMTNLANRACTRRLAMATSSVLRQTKRYITVLLVFYIQ